MTNTQTPTKPAFEHTSCPRCAGSGHYGPTSVYGGRCFQCGGRTVVLTKRGAAAARQLIASQAVAVEHLAVGDLYLDGEPTLQGGVVDVRHIVTALDVDADGTVRIVSERVGRNARLTMGHGFTTSSYTTQAGATVRVLRTPERTAELLAAALAYQATLTKTGRPMRRARRVAA